MSSFENDWRIQDEEDEIELDEQNYGSQRDAILFCIEVTPGILEPRILESGEQGRSTLEVIFQAAADLQKRKVVHGPADAVGIMLFNTAETKGDIVKPHMYLYQHVSQVNAPDIQKLLRLLNEAEDNSDCFPTLFSPSDKSISIANVFLICSHILRDGVPKTATKRVFFFTDNDDPEFGDETKTRAAQKNYEDLFDLGIELVPFFLAQPGQPFDVHKFYSNVLCRSKEQMVDDVILNVHQKFDTLLNDMRMHEATKRTLFNITLQFADSLAIGVKAYGLVTEQRKGSYRYFSNMGKSMEEAFPKTVYIDEEQEREVPKESIVFGYQFGAGTTEAMEAEEDAMQEDAPVVKDKVFYTPEEMKTFRTFNINPSIKILGFKDINTIPFDANVKRAIFIHPNEAAVTGSIRTFKALLDSMLKKQKYALTRCLFRRNSSIIFCAMVPQAEVMDEETQVEPAGFHLIPLPFADDIRQPTIERSAHCSPELRKAAVSIIERMKYGQGYDPDQFPNPVLALHYGFLQAEAFGEEYNPEEDFNDKSAPRFEPIHNRAGKYFDAWHIALDQDPEAAEMAVEPKVGTKRKPGAVDELVVRAHFDDDTLNKLTVEQLKTYLKAHSQPYSGRKNDLIERVHDWCTTHPV
ncbi:Ku DNA-binding complex, Ku70 subunit [Rhizoctonia solani]|nr:Ku DNA-binding complex, Ku70 subunit [Rhizoctonia solani]